MVILPTVKPVYYMKIMEGFYKMAKVKPKKITQGFCEHCGKDVKFRLDWEGCVWPTRKGIIAYRELYAYCPHCYRPIYVPAVNDVNVYRREKAYAEIPIEADEIENA